MVRRYSDPIEVRDESSIESSAGSSAGSAAGSAAARPQAFIWRGRLYVVREVLGHWRERRAWWREALDPRPGQPVGLSGAALEQQVWRVEASSGRLHSSGVYDLVRDEVPQPGQPDWRLVRVAD